MIIKKIVRKLHLWLGLSSGLIVLFLGLTGCILAFQREIEDAVQSYRFTEARTTEPLPPSALKTIADRQLPGKKLHSIGYQKGRSATAVYYAFQPEEYYHIVFLNPYTGEVLEVKDMSKDFFRVVINGHYYLWLPPHIGQPILATATLLFVILMVTGIILWWPRHLAVLKQRLMVKWNARWRRVNYDLHNVFGFYMSWVALFIALTGLVMGFQWFSKSAYYVLSGGKAQPQYSETFSDTTGMVPVQKDRPAMDIIWAKTMNSHRNFGGVIDVHPPESSKSAIEVAVNPDSKTYWKTDYRYYDQYTLQEIEVNHLYGRIAKASVADKALRMNYDIHVGAIGGLPGKIIAFTASLIAASLPVTGFLIWRGRKKKKRQNVISTYAGGRQPGEKLKQRLSFPIRTSSGPV